MAKDSTGRLHVTVRTGGKRKLSSKLWLERQLNDPYVAQAKREGFRSRAAYKLIEIDDKYHLLKRGMTVVDLGAAPGGWSQIAARRVGATDGNGRVIAIDLLEMPELPGVTFTQLDFMREDAPEKLMAMLDGIKNKTDPGEPLDKDIYDLEAEELAKVPKAPGSLDVALDSLEKDQDFLLQGDVFTRDVISTWI